MEAEANPSGDATKSRIDAIRNEIEEKINRIATKKNVTFEEIEKLMLDENDDTEDILYKLKMDCQSYQRSQISIPPPPLCSSPYLKGDKILIATTTTFPTTEDFERLLKV